MRKKITFEENGGEYYGTIDFKGTEFKQIDTHTIRLNGVIEIDEAIVEVEDIPT